MFNNRALLLLAAGICFLISGCLTPIQEKYHNLEVSYKSGELTTDEYTAAKQKIMQEELEQAKVTTKADYKASHTKKEHGQ